MIEILESIIKFLKVKQINGESDYKQVLEEILKLLVDEELKISSFTQEMKEYKSIFK